MSVTNNTELQAYFADIIRAEATEALALQTLLSEAEVLRYETMARATARSITIEPEFTAEGITHVVVVAHVEDFFLTRRFDASDLLDHLAQVIKWAAAKERRAWAELPVIE